MTTKRKKRTPKPTANSGTLTLIRPEFISFLNTPDDEKSLVAAMVPILNHWAKAIGDVSDFIQHWTNNQKAINAIRENQSDVRLALKGPMDVPLWKRFNRSLRKLHPKLKPYPSIGKIFLSSFPCSTLLVETVVEGERRFRYPTDQKDFDRVWIPGFQAKMFSIVAEALEPGSIFDMKKSNFSYYLGVCPRCGKAFEKTMRNQLYDRDTCKVAVSKKKNT